MTWHACSVTPPARRLISQGPVAAHCRAQTDACCWEKQQQTDNNRLKISIGLNNHLQIAYLAFQCLPVLYQVRHFRYRYRNRYRFSISIGSIGIGGVGGIVLTLVSRCSTPELRSHRTHTIELHYRSAWARQPVAHAQKLNNLNQPGAEAYRPGRAVRLYPKFAWYNKTSNYQKVKCAINFAYAWTIFFNVTHAYLITAVRAWWRFLTRSACNVMHCICIGNFVILYENYKLLQITHNMHLSVVHTEP